MCVAGFISVLVCLRAPQSFARFPRRQPCNTKASSPSAMFWHDALASVGCPSPLSSFCICQFRLHYTALQLVDLWHVFSVHCFCRVLQHAPTCPNEMIRYDKNLQPIPMFDHRISSLFVRAVSLSVLYASQLGR